MIDVCHSSATQMATLSMLVALALPLRAQGGGDAPAPSRSAAGTIPAGTRIEARLEEAIDAAHSRIGDRFTARVTRPSLAANQRVQVPEGAIVTGTIAGLQRAHGTLTPAYVRLTIESISFGGQVHPMQAVVEGTSAAAETAEQGRPPIRRSVFPGSARGSMLAGVNADGAMKGSLISLGTDDAALRLARGTILNLRTN